MRCTLFPVLLCIILKSVDVAHATGCTVNKYEEGFGDRIKCWNVSLSTALNQDTKIVAAIVLFQSQLGQIPDFTFSNYSKSLETITLNNCSIRAIGDNAFAGLSFLKKLNLPNNFITEVKEQWFAGLVVLEQLDLSFNTINTINPRVFTRLSRLKRLDISENRLTCLEPSLLSPMGAFEKIRFTGNPLAFQCRGKLTLWLRDHGINYNNDQHEKEKWLDNLLWLCAMSDPKVALSEDLTKECVILNMFNQLRTGLVTAESFPLNVPQQCIRNRDELTKCLSADSNAQSNGSVIKRLLLQLRDVKSVV